MSDPSPAPERPRDTAGESARVLPRSKRRRLWAALWRFPVLVLFALALLLLGPLAVFALGGLDMDTHWSQARHDSSRQSPLPADLSEPIVQVFAARTFGWRGAFGVHSWVAVKHRDADHYRVFQVIGWNLAYGRSAVSVRDDRPPDAMWFNARPQLLAERRGAGVQALIARIETAVADYPYTNRYSAWPGPNSNTFVAYIARRVPELGLDLPPTAIGKDWLPGGQLIARTPSGTGWQFSLYGLLGLAVAQREGIEINLLALNAGLDFDDLALRLPGLGLVGLQRANRTGLGRQPD